MSNVTELVDSVKNLASQLEKSGKSKVAMYFWDVAVQLEISEGNLEILEKLVNSGSISQYADFSHTEDKLFNDVFQKSLDLKNLLCSKGAH